MAQSSYDLQPVVHFVVNFLFVLGEGSALLRLWTKKVVLRNFGWDDWAMTIVAIVNIGQHAILYLFIGAGAGLPQQEVLKADPTALTVYIVVGANVFVTTGTWVLYCLQCIPIEAYWYPERHPDVQCLPFALSLWLPASALIAVDWAIFFLPLSTVLSLQMTLKRRLQVLAVIGTGGASVLVSCLRLIVIDRFTKTDDFIWETGNICIVSAAEMEVAILAANMPGMRALWKSWRGGTLKSGSGGTGPSRPADNGKGGGTSSNGDHALVTFGSKKSRPVQELMHDTELLLTVNEETDAMTGSDELTSKQCSRSTNSDEELGCGMLANPKDIVVSRQVVVTEERSANPGYGN
ncbi:hypothetical protein DL766_004933 [Monosporascus sp. MC13-8B]|uniref:Rhodopsin domain-containing protein n=1 Tax=Monosporascus cannonballus TaxID=155416 RepID=A0ABY0GUF5_9PEZI|nr:hypothetical protein DL762_009215 [Monosporascus cannonballus]RYP30261.1 hypothetical protein DL766_004933 [Monosporascus sp. MC13-8B]